MFDGKAFGEEMVAVVREFVDAELRPLRAANEALVARVAELEAREVSAPAKGEPGRDGADCDMEAVERMIDERFAALPAAEPGAPGEPGRDGKDVDVDAVRAMIAEQVAALPPAEKGEPGEPGTDGRDVDMDIVTARVDAAVKAEFAALPPPEPGAPGKDGLGLANALIDRAGNLVVTFTDGSDKNLGQVVGRDGENGKDGHTFTLDDFDIEPIDERTIKMGFTYGEVKHTFELAIPAVIYRGVWREGIYQRGDMATWAGSIWHCDADGCSEKPDAGSWTLAVKRGRDGRDAK